MEGFDSMKEKKLLYFQILDGLVEGCDPNTQETNKKDWAMDRKVMGSQQLQKTYPDLYIP